MSRRIYLGIHGGNSGDGGDEREREINIFYCV